MDLRLGSQGNGQCRCFSHGDDSGSRGQLSPKRFPLPHRSLWRTRGAFDIWNVDYVQLDKDRNAADSIVTEPAIARTSTHHRKQELHFWPWWLDMSNSLANRPSSLTFTYRRMGTVPSGVGV